MRVKGDIAIADAETRILAANGNLLSPALSLKNGERIDLAELLARYEPREGVVDVKSPPGWKLFRAYHIVWAEDPRTHVPLGPSETQRTNKAR